MRLLSYIILSAVIFLTSFIFHNIKDEIIYDMPQAVQDSLMQRIVSVKSKYKEYNFYCIVSTFHDTTTLVMSEYEKKEKSFTNTLIKSSNRLIEINQNRIPILFYSDFLYSKTFNVKKKDGIISGNYIGGGYYIKFYGKYNSCKILKTGVYN